MASHLYPPLHTPKPPFATHFSQRLSLTPEPLNTFSTSIPSTFQTLFSHFQPANHLPPSVQVFSIPFASHFSTSTPTAFTPQNRTAFLQRPPRFCNLSPAVYELHPRSPVSQPFPPKPAHLPPAATIDRSLKSPLENRQSPHHRKCYPPTPPQDNIYLKFSAPILGQPTPRSPPKLPS